MSGLLAPARNSNLINNLEFVTLHRLALAPFRADTDAGIILETQRQALALGGAFS